MAGEAANRLTGRSRKAVVTAMFGYASMALGLVSGLVVFPMTVRTLGPHVYGLWLASGEAVGYLLLLDAGVFTVLPWLVAGADGRGDVASVRHHTANGLLVGVMLAIGLAAAAAVVWLVPAGVPFVPAEDRELVRGPLALLLALTAVGYPLKVFTAVLGGLQDVTFTGAVAVGQTALTAALTLAAVWLGYGLWGLAFATGGPVVLTGVICLPRLGRLAPTLVRGWPTPSWRGVRHLLVEGSGAWLSGFGYRLLTASGGLILVATGYPGWATLYAATAKAGQIAQQACWMLPDSALVGLAQVHGGGDAAAARRLVLCTLHLHMLTSGTAAIALLAFNPAFVRLLLGEGVYAGDYVNVLLVVGMLLGSFCHGVFKAVAVVGKRPLIGMLTLFWGLAHCGGGLVALHLRGLPGLAEAGVVIGAAAGLVPAVVVLAQVYGIGPQEVVWGVLARWLLILVPFLAAGGVVAATFGTDQLSLLLACAAVAGGIYFMVVRCLLATVPWPESIRAKLTRFRVIR